jgi:hypothetical protein
MAPKNNINNILVACGNDIVSKGRILDSLKGLNAIPVEMQTDIANQAIGLLTMSMDDLGKYIPESDRIIDFK